MTFKDRLARWIANHLPRLVVYFAVVRARDEVEAMGAPVHGSITVSRLLSLLHVIMRDGDLTRIDHEQ